MSQQWRRSDCFPTEYLTPQGTAVQSRKTVFCCSIYYNARKRRLSIPLFWHFRQKIFMILVAFPFCLRSSALFGILTISIPFRTAIGLYIRKGTASRGVSDSETAAGGVMENTTPHFSVGAILPRGFPDLRGRSPPVHRRIKVNLTGDQ